MTILVLAEKPNQGKKYAKALEVSKNQNDCIEGFSPILNDYTIVTWAKGHLVGLCDFKEYDKKYEKWNLSDYPFLPSKMKRKVLPYTSSQFYAIKKLVEKNLTETRDSIIIATDPEREGENIAYSILNFIPHVKNNNIPIKRLWANTQEPQELKNYFQNLKTSKETFPLYLEADARAIADNLIGFNFTVQLTLLLRNKGIAGLYTVGRVQTPTLFMVYEREKAIKNFKKENYYTLSAYDRVNQVTFKDKHKHKFPSKEDALAYLSERNIKIDDNQEGIIEDIQSKIKAKSSPSLLKLGGIQNLANRKWGYSLKRTLSVVQSLYDKGYVSYPRTDCNYITQAEFNYLSDNLQSYKKLLDKPFEIKNNQPRNKYVNDEKVLEHYAIIVTKTIPSKQDFESFSTEQQNIYQSILEHTLGMFAGDYEYKQTNVNVSVQDLEFTTRGQTVIQSGWKEVISSEKEDNKLLPSYTKGWKFTDETPLVLQIEKKETTPPKRLTEASLGGEGGLMENCGKLVDEDEDKSNLSDGIGTPATRSQIVASLISKEYLKVSKNKLYMTDKGTVLCQSLDGTDISSVKMTADWEKNLKSISQQSMKRETFIEKIKEFIVHFSNQLPSYIDNNISSSDVEKVTDDFGKCPVCKQGKIVKRKTKKGKIFYPCSSSSCDFVIWSEMSHRKLRDREIKELVNYQKTSKLKGFKSRNNKSFEACLKIDNNKVVFDFANNNTKGENSNG